MENNVLLLNRNTATSSKAQHTSAILGRKMAVPKYPCVTPPLRSITLRDTASLLVTTGFAKK